MNNDRSESEPGLARERSAAHLTGLDLEELREGQVAWVLQKEKIVTKMCCCNTLGIYPKVSEVCHWHCLEVTVLPMVVH